MVKGCTDLRDHSFAHGSKLLLDLGLLECTRKAAVALQGVIDHFQYLLGVGVQVVGGTGGSAEDEVANERGPDDVREHLWHHQQIAPL